MTEATLIDVTPAAASDPAPVLATRPAADLVPAAPAALAIEQILQTAVERGVDAANLERLVALYERVNAQRNEQALIAALHAFRAECPPILKNRDATKGTQTLYRYADLSEITKVVDPVLFRHQLAYGWGMRLEGELTVITCTVRHVGGGRTSSDFYCKATGTSMMSAAQVAASAVTFGKRQSLVCVLGIHVDDDDDGRRAPPMPRPDPDPSAPRVGTRAERAAQAAQPQPSGDGPPPVTAEDLKGLLSRWREATKRPNGTVTDFAAWVVEKLKLTDGYRDLTRVAHWSVDLVEATRQAMAEVRG